MSWIKVRNFFSRNFISLIIMLTAFITAIVLATFFINLSVERNYREAEANLRVEADAFISNASERFHGSTSLLRALRGFFAGSERVTRNEFYEFLKTTNFKESYPGFSAFSYIERVPQANKDVFLKKIRSDFSHDKGHLDFFITPEGVRDEYWPIVYAYPENEVKILLGVDQSMEPVRAENIGRSRDLGDISVSGVIQLKQGGSGVIISAPLYSGVNDHANTPISIKERQQMFSGAITASLVLNDFFSSVLSLSQIIQKNIGVSILGRTGEILPIHMGKDRNDFFSRLYGDIKINKQIALEKTTTYELTFKGSVANLLSFQELVEPFLLGILFFSAASFFSLVIIFLSRRRELGELRKKYAFISTLSHQLRTPISRLRWAVELLEVPFKQKPQRLRCLKEVSDLNTIVSKLLLYLEITNKIKSEKELITVKAFCSKIIETLSNEKRIMWKQGGMGGRVFVNEGQIISASLNIVDNALTYSPKKEKVVVEFKVSKNFLVIEISDKGIGIPHNEQQYVFKEFFRASNASLGKNTGSGVSLFITKRVVELHDGSIEFTSKEGEGSVVTVSLPITGG